MSALDVLRDVLPPMGMTSLPVEPTKPAQANAQHEAVRQVEALVAAARELTEDAAVDDIDPRLDYVVVQMGRESLPTLRAALAPFAEPA